jgi:nitrate reductase assembly molybdenum cofactor insertion protein NarJ
MKKQVTWNDLQTATPKELKDHYKLGQRQMEQAFRKHLKGADQREMQKQYKDFYDRGKK